MHYHMTVGCYSYRDSTVRIIYEICLYVLEMNKTVERFPDCW